MNRKVFLIVLCLMMALSVDAVAFAAGGIEYPMTYKKGTSDTVSVMPANDSGIGGSVYAVSEVVPQRAGYEFLGWELDYGLFDTCSLTYQVKGDPEYGMPGDSTEPQKETNIKIGSDVKPADALVSEWDTPDGKPYQGAESYTVRYLELGTDIELAPTHIVPNKKVGDEIDEYAIDIAGYDLFSDYTQHNTIQRSKVGVWEFTGWCSDEDCTKPVSEVSGIETDTTLYGKWNYSEVTVAENEIIFYYDKSPEPAKVWYTVRHIDVMTGEMLSDDDMFIGTEGETVTLYAKEFRDYEPLNRKTTWQVQADGIVLFLYYYHNDPIF